MASSTAGANALSRRGGVGPSIAEGLQNMGDAATIAL